MKRKSQNITNKLPAAIALLAILVFWQLAAMSGIVPHYMLPSPVAVFGAFVANFSNIMANSVFTLQETFFGLLLGILLSFITATVMDRFDILNKAFSPLIIITQTIPTIAIAPILVLWFGYGMAPKIVLVILTTYFPITIGLLGGYKSVDQESIDLMRAMGASRVDIFRHLKFPQALPQFFSGLKVAASYAVVGAVVAEWLGGFSGLGVMMTRMQKAYAFDAMFAIIIFIVVISLLLLLLVHVVSRAVMPWQQARIIEREK
ncbi:MAG: ABC transporter permease [Eubacterium sp.]|nr:ABC transporter permease [Candidatus Colimonas fimequi]